MKCAVNDGRDSVNINNINRYCNEHYQIYDMLAKLYRAVSGSGSNGSISWREYLTRVLDNDFNAPWKISLIDASNGGTLDPVANVAAAELKMST